MIQGLKSKAELNGRFAVVMASEPGQCPVDRVPVHMYEVKRGRRGVVQRAEEEVAVKPECLLLVKRKKQKKKKDQSAPTASS